MAHAEARLSFGDRGIRWDEGPRTSRRDGWRLETQVRQLVLLSLSHSAQSTITDALPHAERKHFTFSSGQASIL